MFIPEKIDQSATCIGRPLIGGDFNVGVKQGSHFDEQSVYLLAGRKEIIFTNRYAHYGNQSLAMGTQTGF